MRSSICVPTASSSALADTPGRAVTSTTSRSLPFARSNVKAFAADHPHKLLERFAAALADLVCEEFGARWVKVSVAKPAPIAGVRQIGVRVERGQRSA